MRTARILGDSSVSTYHVISRVIERRKIFGSEEREYFRNLIRAQEGFSGVRVMTWALMSNHFHLLVIVDEEEGKVKKAEMTDEDLLERLKHIYGEISLREIKSELKRLGQRSSKRQYEEYRGRFFKRMYDLSAFVGELKQRFSSYFNQKTERKGPLWEDRFKSLLLEGKGGDNLVLVIGAYIDLNPVRAGITEDPADYRHCGYAAAVAGDVQARERIAELLGMIGEEWDEVGQAYRSLLMEVGVEELDDDGKVVRKGIPIETVEKERSRSYRLTCRDKLLKKLRYFTEGLVLGSAEFVERQFERNREKLGVKRGKGARVPKDEWLEQCGLHVMQDLRGEI